MNQFEDHEAHDALPVEEEVQGSVVEWLARDSRDHVALFTAVLVEDLLPAGLDEIDEHRRVLAAILGIPPTTRSVFGVPLGNELAERWRSFVERGLFVFAAHRDGGPYWIAEAPQEPLRVVDLPQCANELMTRQPPLALPFKHVSSVMPDTLGHVRIRGMTGRRLS